MKFSPRHPPQETVGPYENPCEMDFLKWEFKQHYDLGGKKKVFFFYFSMYVCQKEINLLKILN